MQNAGFKGFEVLGLSWGLGKPIGVLCRIAFASESCYVKILLACRDVTKSSMLAAPGRLFLLRSGHGIFIDMSSLGVPHECMAGRQLLFRGEKLYNAIFQQARQNQARSARPAKQISYGRKGPKKPFLFKKVFLVFSLSASAGPRNKASDTKNSCKRPAERGGKVQRLSTSAKLERSKELLAEIRQRKPIVGHFLDVIGFFGFLLGGLPRWFFHGRRSFHGGHSNCEEI